MLEPFDIRLEDLVIIDSPLVIHGIEMNVFQQYMAENPYPIPDGEVS